MKPGTPVWMKGREAWRQWLERNHARKAEVWLGYHKAHTKKPSVTYVEAVEEALCFGWIDGQVQRIDDDSWCQRFTPRRPGSKWSKVNLRRFARLVGEGRVTEAGHAAGPTKETKVADAFWERPDVVPPEIAKLIQVSKKAWSVFQALPPYKRKMYVIWLVSAKREETRGRRAAEAIGMLERGEHPMDQYRKKSRSPKVLKS
jgi:uncharacterized protein YdeI (YjbR/CyaY-like superfamily)